MITENTENARLYKNESGKLIGIAWGNNLDIYESKSVKLKSDKFCLPVGLSCYRETKNGAIELYFGDLIKHFPRYASVRFARTKDNGGTWLLIAEDLAKQEYAYPVEFVDYHGKHISLDRLKAYANSMPTERYNIQFTKIDNET